MSVQVFELSLAIGKGFRPSSNHPGIQPATGRNETLESLDRFQSSVQMRIVEFDEIGVIGTLGKQEITEQHLFSVPNRSQDIFERPVAVRRGFGKSPNGSLRIDSIFKHGFLQREEKISVLLLAPHPQSHPNILQIVVVTQLETGMWKYLVQSLLDSRPIIRHDDLQIVPETFQLSEETRETHLVLGHVQSAEGDVMGQVVDTENEGNLPSKTFHRYVLSVHDQDARETPRIAEGSSEFLVFRQQRQFLLHPQKSLFARQTVFIAQSAKRNAVEVFDPE